MKVGLTKAAILLWLLYLLFYILILVASDREVFVLNVSCDMHGHFSHSGVARVYGRPGQNALTAPSTSNNL